MIKIAFIINSLRNNGPVNVLLNMVYGIDRQKYNVSVITLIDENDENIINELKNINVTVIELNLKKNIFSMFSSKKLSKVIADENFDIIHTHSHVPTVMASGVRVKKVSTVHCRLNEDFEDTYGKVKGKIINFFYVNALKKYDKVISCSKAVNDVVSKYIKDSTYVMNGIDFQFEKDNRKKELLKELKISLNAKIYIYLGGLTYRKNVLTMVNKMDELMNDDEYLLLLGDGDLKNEIDVITKRNDHIKLLGFIDDVKQYLLISDYYVSFSTSEGLPISVIEALSCNLKVFLSDIPSHKEFFNIDNKKYIGEYFNGKNIKEKLNELRKESRCDSFELYKSNFTSKCMMKRYMKIYDDILKI